MKKKYFTKEEELAARRLKRYKKTFNTSVLKEKYIVRIPFSDCWYWNGKLWDTGYGFLRVKSKYFPNIKCIAAHRYMYAIYKGAFDTKLHVLHKCDNPSCVNPDHLFLGNHSDNMKDMYAKNRRTQKGIHNGNYKHGNRTKEL